MNVVSALIWQSGRVFDQYVLFDVATAQFLQDYFLFGFPLQLHRNSCVMRFDNFALLHHKTFMLVTTSQIITPNASRSVSCCRLKMTLTCFVY